MAPTSVLLFADAAAAHSRRDKRATVLQARNDFATASSTNIFEQKIGRRAGEADAYILRDGKAKLLFYQCVSFIRGSKLINSWAMLYPTSERSTYAPKAITRTYKVSAGQTGYCDE